MIDNIKQLGEKLQAHPDKIDEVTNKLCAKIDNGEDEVEVPVELCDMFSELDRLLDGGEVTDKTKSCIKGLTPKKIVSIVKKGGKTKKMTVSRTKMKKGMKAGAKKASKLTDEEAKTESFNDEISLFDSEPMNEDAGIVTAAVMGGFATLLWLAIIAWACWCTYVVIMALTTGNADIVGNGMGESNAATGILSLLVFWIAGFGIYATVAYIQMKKKGVFDKKKPKEKNKSFKMSDDDSIADMFENMPDDPAESLTEGTEVMNPMQKIEAYRIVLNDLVSRVNDK